MNTTRRRAEPPGLLAELVLVPYETVSTVLLRVPYEESRYGTVSQTKGIPTSKHMIERRSNIGIIPRCNSTEVPLWYGSPPESLLLGSMKVDEDPSTET